jgi:hypothetical protein
MRLTSGFFVSALLRRAGTEGVFAALRRRGAEEAGAIFVKVDRLDGTALLLGPAAQADYAESRPSDRLFRALAEGPAEEAEARLSREARFDPDIWIVEIEDRAGRAFVDTLPDEP